MWVNQLTFSDQKADYSCITAYPVAIRADEPRLSQKVTAAEFYRISPCWRCDYTQGV